MSYDVQLYRREVQEKHAQQPDEAFFEEDENILPFTPAQRQGLHDRLLRYRYQLVSRQLTHHEYELVQQGAARVSAQLFDGGLYFSVSPASTEDIFDIGMTASEFTDGGDFAKYDPQLGDWENWED